MDHTYLKRRAAADRAGQSAAPFAAGSTAFSLPNSARLGADQGGMGRAALRHAMREKMAARFGPDYRNSGAEAEADRIGGRFSSAAGVEDLKARMGSALGADFSSVRFHTGAEASAMAAASHAHAFTSGRDIFLGGSFDAATAAHEMVHTIQQGAVQASAPVMSAPMGAVQYRKKEEEEEPEDEEDTWIYRNVTGPHRKALDQLNNHTHTFNEMHWTDRAKWAIQNPIAYLRGGGNSRNETEERNAEKRQEEEMAAAVARYREKDRRREAEKAGRPLLPSKPVPGVEESGASSGASAPGWMDMAKTAAGDWGTGTGASALAMPNEISKTRQAFRLKGTDGKLNNLSDRYVKGIGLFNMTKDFSNGVGRIQAGNAEDAEGNHAGAMQEGAYAAADFLSTTSDAIGLGGYDPVSASVSAMANMARAGTGLVSAAGNGISAGTLAWRNSSLKDETEGLASKPPEELTDEERYQLTRQRAVSQAIDAAGIRAASGMFTAASSTVRATGDILNAGMPEGPGQIANAVSGVVAGGIDALGNAAVADEKEALHRNTVNEETNLDEGTQYVQQHGWEALEGYYSGKRLPKTKAERIHLKSMGFENIQDAFNAITMHRAKALAERANAGGVEETGIMNNMFLSPVRNPQTGKEEYNPNAVAKKLGREDLPPENPFAADAEAEKKRQEEDRRRTEEARKHIWDPGAERRELQKSYNHGWF